MEVVKSLRLDAIGVEEFYAASQAIPEKGLVRVNGGTQFKKVENDLTQSGFEVTNTLYTAHMLPKGLSEHFTEQGEVPHGVAKVAVIEYTSKQGLVYGFATKYNENVEGSHNAAEQ